jgi:predicted transcriptional regulator
MHVLKKREINLEEKNSSMSLKKEEELLVFELNNQKDSFKLLIILWNRGKLYGERILKEGMNDRTLIRVRDLLLKFNLIKVTPLDGSRRLYYELTPKGKRVVEKVVDLERQLMAD